MIPNKSEVLGVLLAGGQARRMGGGDKCLTSLGNHTVLAHVLKRARPQVGDVILNANDDPARFDAYGVMVVPDVIPDRAGPLAGILTGMEWAARHRPQCPWIATFAADTPFFPDNLVSRMLGRIVRRQADIVFAASGGQDHPVFGLWPVTLRDDLRTALVEQNIRRVSEWADRHQLTRVAYPDRPSDPFFNINTPEDLKLARAKAQDLPAPPPSAGRRKNLSETRH